MNAPNGGNINCLRKKGYTFVYCLYDRISFFYLVRAIYLFIQIIWYLCLNNYHYGDTSAGLLYYVSASIMCPVVRVVAALTWFIRYISYSGMILDRK